MLLARYDIVTATTVQNATGKPELVKIGTVKPTTIARPNITRTTRPSRDLRRRKARFAQSNIQASRISSAAPPVISVNNHCDSAERQTIDVGVLDHSPNSIYTPCPHPVNGREWMAGRVS